MSGISSCIAAIKLINSDKQTPDDEDARFELRCAECYGAAVRIAPEACPMCRGTVWEHVPSRCTDEVFAA
jgi:rubrerythrin